MNWLAQNWIWVAVAIGAAFFFLRGGAGRHATGHGSMGHGAGHGGAPGAMGHGADAGGGHQAQAQPPALSAPEAAIDPVGGEAVRTSGALTSVYQGMIYYFASKENRDRFEAAPQEYASKAAGHPVRAAGTEHERPRRRRGC